MMFMICLLHHCLNHQPYKVCAFVFSQREIRMQLAEKAKAGELKVVNGSAASQAATKRKRRWDQTADQTPSNATPKKMSSWDQADANVEVIYSHF